MKRLPPGQMIALSCLRFIACILLLCCATRVTTAAGTAGELVQQGIAAGQAEKFDEAVTKFTEALKTKPTPAEAAAAFLWRADAYVHKGQFDLAWADLNETISRDPKQRKAYYLQRIYIG